MSDYIPNDTYASCPPSSSQAFFSTSHLGNITPIPDYAHTSENAFESSKRTSQAIEHGAFDDYGSCNEPTEVYSEMVRDAADGRWSSGPSSMGWGADLHSWSGKAGLGYAMTSMERGEGHYEASGKFEAFGVEIFEQQSELEATQTMGTVSYSHTHRNDTSGRSNPIRGPDLGYLSPYQQMDINDARHKDQPRQGPPFSEPTSFPSTCPRASCGGKYEYPTLQSYHTHVRNVHEKDIFCLVSGCSRRHTEPFNSENDRRRHHTAKHDRNAPKRFICREAVCRARVKAFHRRDKLSDHDKKYHAPITCNICSQYFHGSDEVSRHINFRHGAINLKLRSV